MIYIALEIYPDEPPEAECFTKDIKLPDNSDDPMVYSAVRDAVGEWLRKRKETSNGK